VTKMSQSFRGSCEGLWSAEEGDKTYTLWQGQSITSSDGKLFCLCDFLNVFCRFASFGFLYFFLFFFSMIEPELNAEAVFLVMLRTSSERARS
jgi:hypothetical protein